MQCPLCLYQLSDFDAVCPKCHGKGIPKPAVAAPPMSPSLPYNPTIPRPAPEPPRKGISPVAIGALVLVPVMAAFAALNFFGLQISPKASSAPTVVATSAPAVVPAAAPAPIVTPTASGRTMVSERDAAWIEKTLPIMKEASLAERKFLDSRGKTPSEAAENLTELKASMEQVRLKLLSAPRSTNFSKSSSLFFDGVNKTATGADLVLIGYAFKNTPSGQSSIKDGGEQLIMGGDLMESGLKAASETMDELGIGK